MLTRTRFTVSALSPDAIRLCLATALSSLPIGYLSIVLPIYLNKVGINPRDIGGLYAVSSIVSAILIVVFGLLADRFGRKPFVLIGLLLPVVSYIIFLATTDLPWLTLAAGIGGVGLAQGLSGALSGAGFNAWLAEKSTEANRTLVFSIGSAAWTSALMLGALLGGSPEWLQSFGVGVVASYQPLFWLSLSVTAVGALAIWPIREEHKASGAAKGWRHLMPHRSVVPIIQLSIFMGLLGLGLGFIVELMPLWFNLKFGVSGDFLGPWYAASNALSLVAVYIIPKLTRRVGASNALILTQGVSTIFLATMIFAPVALVAAALFLVRQFLMNLAWPVQQSYIQGAIEPNERGAGNSLTFGAWGLANSISPAISGEWLKQGFLALPLAASAASYLLSVALFYVFFRKVAVNSEQ
ncbi:MAG: MFS transporter [Chloroflexota bacterium]